MEIKFVPAGATCAIHAGVLSFAAETWHQIAALLVYCLSGGEKVVRHKNVLKLARRKPFRRKIVCCLANRANSAGRISCELNQAPRRRTRAGATRCPVHRSIPRPGGKKICVVPAQQPEVVGWLCVFLVITSGLSLCRASAAHIGAVIFWARVATPSRCGGSTKSMAGIQVIEEFGNGASCEGRPGRAFLRKKPPSLFIKFRAGPAIHGWQLESANSPRVIVSFRLHDCLPFPFASVMERCFSCDVLEKQNCPRRHSKAPAI